MTHKQERDRPLLPSPSSLGFDGWCVIRGFILRMSYPLDNIYPVAVEELTLDEVLGNAATIYRHQGTVGTRSGLRKIVRH